MSQKLSTPERRPVSETGTQETTKPYSTRIREWRLGIIDPDHAEWTQALATALDALREAVKGCGVIGKGGVRCCFYWRNLGMYEPCSRACHEKLDRALHALLGDVELTPHRERPDDWDASR